MCRARGCISFAPLMLPVMVAFALVSACERGGEVEGPEVAEIPPAIELSRLEESVSGSGFTRLEPEATGLHFEATLLAEHDRAHLSNGSGLTVGDYDGDGRPDLYFTAMDGDNILYRQVAPWRFEDRTAQTGTAGPDAWAKGAAFVDVDGDQDLDLYVTYLNASNRLYRNDGEGSFEDISEGSGIDVALASVMPAFADIDGDGDLDLYLLTTRAGSTEEDLPEDGVDIVDGEIRVDPQHRDAYAVINGNLVRAGQRDRLFRNRGDGTFDDITESSGIDGHEMGLSATWLDFDRDLRPDLYVANDLMGADHLYRNLGEGRFVDVAPEMLSHTTWFSMGSDAADVDGDGLVDILVADMSSTTHYKEKTTMGSMSELGWFLEFGQPRQYMRNALHRNTGTGRFMEVAYLAGLESTDWTWAVRFGDLDSDGRQDVFFTTGHSRNANFSDYLVEERRLVEEGRMEEADAYESTIPPLNERNRVFRNAGDLMFESRGASWGLDALGVSHGASVSDLDGDGDLDIAISNLNAPAALYRNDLAQGHRFVVELRGTGSPRHGIGARVELLAGGRRQIREMFGPRGYLTHDQAQVHFGLGEATRIDELVVHWPSGQRQVFLDLPADRRAVVRESGAREAREPESLDALASARSTWFVEAQAASAPGFVHRELPFDDFEREPLLPWRLSTAGPGVAVADVDGDGRDDIAVTGAAGQASALYLQGGGGRFVASSAGRMDDIAAEGLGILVADLDADGREDLFIGSGGNEADLGSSAHGDRFFAAHPDGGFRAASTRVLEGARRPTGALAAADLDRDGALEIFAGGTTEPGSYPTGVASVVWRRGEGGLEPSRADGFAALRDLSRVRGARFADLDGDGWTDLLAATEWGPIRYLRNEAGTFVDRTESAGLAELTGLWNGVEVADLDGDGDLDFIATNLGLNTKYRASDAQPLTIYVADFDGDGRRDLVESMHEEERIFPVRGLSCTSSAMPEVRHRFPTYDSFARATLDDVYGPEALEGASRFEVTTLEHRVFINDGAGRFTSAALPRIAQASAAFGVVAEDFDADGRIDVVLAQNWFAPQRETGRVDGGLGQLLAGGASGAHLSPIEPLQSGIVVPEDATGLAVGDFDDDGAPDLVFATNQGRLRVYLNRAAPPSRFVRLDLLGEPGNLHGVGSRVELRTREGRRLWRDVGLGGGYLSQSSATLFFGIPEGDAPLAWTIRWPDGTVMERVATPGENRVAYSTTRLDPASP